MLRFPVETKAKRGIWKSCRASCLGTISFDDPFGPAISFDPFYFSPGVWLQPLAANSDSVLLALLRNVELFLLTAVSSRVWRETKLGYGTSQKIFIKAKCRH